MDSLPENVAELRQPPYPADALARHTRKTRRRYDSAPKREYGTIADLVCRWLMWWNRVDYPGLQHGMLQLLDWKTDKQSLLAWRCGKRRLPLWAGEILLAEMNRRVEAGIKIRDELQRYCDEWQPYDRSKPAFLRVDPETGQRRKFRG